MHYAVFWDVTPCGPLTANQLRLLVTADVVRSSPIIFTLIMEAIHSSETSVPTRATRRNIPEYGTLQNHRRENLESDVQLVGIQLPNTRNSQHFFFTRTNQGAALNA
jgi:hypothetical protein